MNYRLYQINLTNDEVNRINELGDWGAAGREMPRVAARNAVTFADSADDFRPEFFQFYDHVADIVADDLEDAFFVHNNPFGNEVYESRITRYAVQHSMSVGDILINEDNVAFMVLGIGFTPGLFRINDSSEII